MRSLPSVVFLGLCLVFLFGCGDRRIPERPEVEDPAPPAQPAASKPATHTGSFVARTISLEKKEEAVQRAVQRLARIQNTILQLRVAVFNAKNHPGPLQSSERIFVQQYQHELVALSRNPDGTIWSGDLRDLDELRPRFGPVIENYNRENQELQRTLAEAARNEAMRADLVQLLGAGPVPCTTAQLPKGSGEMPPERWPDLERLVQKIHELTDELKRITTESGVQVYANRQISLRQTRQDIINRAARMDRSMAAGLSPRGAEALRRQYQDALAQLDREMDRLRGLPGGEAFVDGRRPIVRGPAAPPPAVQAPRLPTPVAPPAATAELSPAAQTFLAAHRKVMAISQRLMSTLDGVTDAASARLAGPRLTELTPRLKTAMRRATALFIALSRPEQQTAMMQAALESEKAQRDRKLIHQSETLIDQMVRVARGPGGRTVRTELRDLRDAFLSSHGPYATVVVRRRIERALGPLGSELAPR